MKPHEPVGWDHLGPSRVTRWLPTLLAIGVLALIAYVGFGSGGKPTPSAPALPASPIVGVVIAVSSPSLGKVRGFSLQTSNGYAYDFTVGVLENPTEFSPSHLAEHEASSEPIRAFYRLEAGVPTVYRLEDAALPT